MVGSRAAAGLIRRLAAAATRSADRRRRRYTIYLLRALGGCRAAAAVDCGDGAGRANAARIDAWTTLGCWWFAQAGTSGDDQGAFGLAGRLGDARPDRARDRRSRRRRPSRCVIARWRRWASRAMTLRRPMVTVDGGVGIDDPVRAAERGGPFRAGGTCCFSLSERAGARECGCSRWRLRRRATWSHRLRTCRAAMGAASSVKPAFEAIEATNAVLAAGSAQQLATIDGLVRGLDVPEARSGGRPCGSWGSRRRTRRRWRADPPVVRRTPPTDEPARPARVEVDAAANTLIVSALRTIWRRSVLAAQANQAATDRVLDDQSGRCGSSRCEFNPARRSLRSDAGADVPRAGDAD